VPSRYTVCGGPGGGDASRRWVCRPLPRVADRLSGLAVRQSCWGAPRSPPSTRTAVSTPARLAFGAALTPRHYGLLLRTPPARGQRAAAHKARLAAMAGRLPSSPRSAPASRPAALPAHGPASELLYPWLAFGPVACVRCRALGCPTARLNVETSLTTQATSQYVELSHTPARP
jgi:hypothetical protein